MATRLIPGLGYVEEQRTSQALVPGMGYVDDPGTGALELLISGPSSVVVGAASDNITVSIVGTITGTVTVTPSDNGGGGTFAPASVALTNSNKIATFTYTANSAGLKDITLSNTGGIDNPDNLYISATAVPSGTITSVNVSGQTVTVSFTTNGEPVSGMATLQADNPANGAITQGPKAVTLGNGTGSVEFMGVPVGDYAGEVITLTNTADTAQATGSVAFKIISISGNPEAPGTTPTATVPGIPTNVVATAGNGSASVTCTPPSNGGSPITGYQVIASSGQSATSATLPVSISVPNGVPVSFQIRAGNVVGQGGLSAASNTVTPAVPMTEPGAPTIGTAIAGNGYIDVYFTAPSSNGGSPITYYTALLSTGESSVGASSPIRVAASNGTARTATVRAHNLVGAGLASESSNSVTPSVSITVPDAPSVALEAGELSITAHVTPPGNTGGSAILSYTVILSTGEQKIQPAGPFVFTGLSVLPRTATAYASNAIGNGSLSAPSNEVTPLEPPPPPTELEADGATVVRIRSESGMLQLKALFSDSPAPPSRTIVLGAQNRNITSGQ